MKLKSFLCTLFFCLSTHVFAANMHLHPKATTEDNKPVAKKLIYPGYCEIEIINDSYTDINVFGTFDDGSTINFDIYRYGIPHYISLFYSLYCHSGMYLTIQSPYYTVYSGWTNVNSTIRIVPYFNKQLKANVAKR